MSSLLLSEISLYPVKSLGGISVSRWRLDSFGLFLDRRWMMVDTEGNFMTQRKYPQMARVVPKLTGAEGTGPHSLILSHPQMGTFKVPVADLESPRVSVRVWSDQVKAVPVAEEADRWLSEAIGVSCQLVWFADDVMRQVDTRYAEKGDRTAFADGFPLLLIGQGSLDDLNRRLQEPLPMRRFRPNLVVTGATPFAEDEWCRIRIGEITLRVVKPCSRCIITTVDPDTGCYSGKEPLRTLATYRRRGNRIYFGQNLVHEGQGEIKVGMEVRIVSAGN